MLRIGKLTDYGILLLIHFGREPGIIQNARDLAGCSHLPLPTVSKVLKMLTRAKILESQRGATGGYRLGRAPDKISMADVIRALEGPVALVDCAGELPVHCDHEDRCQVRTNWQKINDVVVQSLERLTLASMAEPFPETGLPQTAELVHLARRSS